MTDELLNPEKLVFVRKQLEPEEVQGLGSLLAGLGNESLRSANISVVLPLLHEARSKNEKSFLITVFLPWISIQHSVKVHRNRFWTDS